MSTIAHRLLQFMVSCLALSMSATGHADIVPLALMVSGKIQIHNDTNHQTYCFDQRSLQALPQYEMDTSTPWTPVARFRGPLLEDVLDRVKATGTHLDIEAYDGYVAHDIPTTDIVAFHPLLAYMKDGTFLKLRDLGPLFLVYPRDRHQRSLRTSDYSTREIRQIKAIVVK
ncbi:oxidoreductase [Burkholderia ubonensis]|uniref:oxidoreductase n=1 Tax=Burkholderia ubonensis TaxID=101571 RepID=UPI000755B466|nr:oxidoreductase [Burkholderia ubonensis]KVL61355.1 oxidoreductase [Burkholderia ubonensis]KVL82096.1 oxidoreductase [Burkholderia ubonensis]KVM01813.1 oxidoreductase [Burkholderia ubonensis]